MPLDERDGFVRNIAVALRPKAQRLARTNALAFAAGDAVGRIKVEGNDTILFDTTKCASRADGGADTVELAVIRNFDRWHHLGRKIISEVACERS